MAADSARARRRTPGGAGRRSGSSGRDGAHHGALSDRDRPALQPPTQPAVRSEPAGRRRPVRGAPRRCRPGCRPDGGRPDTQPARATAPATHRQISASGGRVRARPRCDQVAALADEAPQLFLRPVDRLLDRLAGHQPRHHAGMMVAVPDLHRDLRRRRGARRCSIPRRATTAPGSCRPCPSAARPRSQIFRSVIDWNGGMS